MQKINLASCLQCGQNNPDMKLQADITAYKAASLNYAEICEKSEVSRDVAVKLRGSRQDAFAKKIEAAEDIIMSVLGEKSSALAGAGLKDFYNELAAGKHNATVLFQIADETTKAFA